MRVAIIIAYKPKKDHSTLMWVLDGYREQKINGYELDILIGNDGTGGPTLEKPFQSYHFQHMGAAAIRNELVKRTSADILIIGNADTRPDPNMVQTHVETLTRLPSKHLVLGSAPFERLAPNVFDKLIDETPMLFSFCHMQGGHYYPFRATYSLNLSVRRNDYLECGGFPEEIRPYAYEDIIFGYRVLGPDRKGLFYQPKAQVTHRHPMTFDQYLDREEILGMMVTVVARYAPTVFDRIMGGRSVKELAKDFTNKTLTPNP